MIVLGHFSMCFAWLLSLAGCLGGVVAARKQSFAFVEMNRRAIIAACFFTLLSLVILGYLFVTDDYRVQYVWQFSNKDMPALYKFTAIWGGMDGSMLLWCGFLSVSTALVAVGARKIPFQLSAWSLPVLHSSTLFFLTVVVFLTNPFRALDAPYIPPDGNGLNPLLQNPYMAIHPPTLYLGFTTLTVPFAFCMAALLSGDLSDRWIRLTRRWTLISWMFLTAGITLGGYWAYIELGWGGFWAWDPVENASFFPWLTMTAFLHSVMVQQRKSMLKIWNVWLIVLSYGLTVFGTFLTRSGVVQSVHAFASTDVGWVFLLYLGLLFALALFATLLRRKELASERQIESFFSRESAFLLNNLVLLSICFATLWGVMFPVLSEALTGEKQAVSIPYFNAVNVPLFLLLLFLMGVGPLIAWRKANWKNVRKSFQTPFITGLIASGLLLWAGITSFYAIVSYGLCVFVTLTIIAEFYRVAKVRKTKELSALGHARQTLKKHRTRYGGYLIHLGVVIAAIGITASMAHKQEFERSLNLNETITLGVFDLTLKNLQQITAEQGNYQALQGLFELRNSSDKSFVAELIPELRAYKRGQETTTEVALHKGMKQDFYLVLAGLDDSGERAAIKVFINPLQNLLWLGVALMILGGLIVLPGKRK